MIKLRRLSVLSAAVALVALTAMHGTNARAGQVNKPVKPVAIEIDNFRFGLASIEVAVGTSVTWTNRDDVPHTVTSSTKVFKSQALDTGEAFSYTFNDTGTFEYYCSLHPHMTGKVIVK